MRETIGATIAKWGGAESDVRGLTLIGSQARAADDLVWRADPESDWDFQVITSRPERFLEPQWLRLAGLPPRVYSVRRAAIGGVPKIAVLFADGEADFVILPARSLAVVRTLVACGVHRRWRKLARMLQDLAIVIRPGWKFLKGGPEWEPFYRRIIADVPDPRLDDSEIIRLADSFVCDYVWVRRKLARGELLAAQRMVHRSLAETNIRFMHELRLRRGQRSFPEARRLERIAAREEALQIAVDAPLEMGALLAATEKMAQSMRQLSEALVGCAWRWPTLRENMADTCRPASAGL